MRNVAHVIPLWLASPFFKENAVVNSLQVTPLWPQSQRQQLASRRVRHEAGWYVGQHAWPRFADLTTELSLKDDSDAAFAFFDDVQGGGSTEPTAFVPEKPGENGLIERAASLIADYVRDMDIHEQSKTKRGNNNDNFETSYSGSLTDLRIMDRDVLAVQVKSLVRVALPSILWAIVSVLLYPSLVMYLAGLEIYDEGVLAVLSQDASQYVQNILSSSGLMFSISVGYTYYFMYQQQEQVSDGQLLN
jgi:hypothetical protein